LEGSFNIKIEERKNKTYSNLPALFVEGVDIIADRHINTYDKSACLCSPLEENEFLEPTFKFELYFEHLIVPFLYGQLFYNSEKRWPWSEYAHGSVGLLDSYLIISDSSKAKECQQKLAADIINWPRIRTALLQKSDIKGHTQCFCPKRDQIRRCHPNAWKGIQLLKNHLRMQGVTILPLNPIFLPT